MILDSDDWKDDDELQKLPTLDILLAFEDYSRLCERDFEDQMRRSQVEKTRRERKVRQGFKVCALSCKVRFDWVIYTVDFVPRISSVR